MIPTSGRKILTSATLGGQGSFIAYAQDDFDSENDQEYLLSSSDKADELSTSSESSYLTIGATRTPDSLGVSLRIEDILNINEVGRPLGLAQTPGAGVRLTPDDLTKSKMYLLSRNLQRKEHQMVRTLVRFSKPISSYPTA